MRYSSTTRLINTILFALMAFGFGVLGIRETFLVAPFLAVDAGPLGNIEIGWGLSAMLGVFGLVGMLISAYGLVNSAMSIVKERDDAPVRRAFSAYIAIGYTIALFCLLNALWLYRLTSTNIGYGDTGFVIVVYVILFLISIIVSNIPLVRMYGETEELNKIMKIILGPIVCLGVSLFLVYGISYLVLANGGARYMKDEISREFGVGALFGLAIAILSSLAFLGYHRADKAGVIRKTNGFLFEGTLIVIAAGIITSGIMEYVSQSKKNPDYSSLVAKTLPNFNANYMDFCVMAWIIGGLMLIGALFLVFSTLKDKEK